MDHAARLGARHARDRSSRARHRRRAASRSRREDLKSYVIAIAALAACRGHGTNRPHPGNAAPLAVEIGRAGTTLRGVAGDATRVYAALSDGKTSDLSAYRGTKLDWHATAFGSAGPIAATGELVVVTVSGTGVLGDPFQSPHKPLELRGEPGAALYAFDAATGAQRWAVTCDATEFAVIAAAAPAGADVVIGGSFSGTLRVDSGASTRVVSSAGKSDGFVARITATGSVAWLVRFGGPGADAVQGVAARDDRIAIAGTFTAGADLLGQALPPYDEKSPFGDGFVAELDATGARRWAQTFGSKADDAVAGVAIDSRGRVAIAATAREPIRIGGNDFAVRGASDGIVAWFSPSGDIGATTVIGGADYDGLRAIAAADDRVVVAGFFSGQLPLGKRTIEAGGGDDAFLATVNAAGEIETAWQVGGPGREEITALASIPGGIVAGVAHSTDAHIGDDRLPAPGDPASGAAIVVRPAP